MISGKQKKVSERGCESLSEFATEEHVYTGSSLKKWIQMRHIFHIIQEKYNKYAIYNILRFFCLTIHLRRN